MGQGRVETAVPTSPGSTDCRRLAETAVEQFGGIDVLCANAGVFPDKPLAELTEADVDEVMAATSRAPCSRCRPACRP